MAVEAMESVTPMFAMVRFCLVAVAAEALSDAVASNS
jgi:hypothetical protein